MNKGWKVGQVFQKSFKSLSKVFQKSTLFGLSKVFQKVLFKDFWKSQVFQKSFKSTSERLLKDLTLSKVFQKSFKKLFLKDYLEIWKTFERVESFRKLWFFFVIFCVFFKNFFFIFLKRSENWNLFVIE